MHEGEWVWRMGLWWAHSHTWGEVGQTSVWMHLLDRRAYRLLKAGTVRAWMNRYCRNSVNSEWRCTLHMRKYWWEFILYGISTFGSLCLYIFSLDAVSGAAPMPHFRSIQLISKTSRLVSAEFCRRRPHFLPSPVQSWEPFSHGVY